VHAARGFSARVCGVGSLATLIPFTDHSVPRRRRTDDAPPHERRSGHGTYSSGGALVSNVSGVVERVNKLVSVRPLHARYSGDIGDVVVGRITEVQSKRWRVDVNGRQDAVLMLSAVNLAGGDQRRRTAEDQLQMRDVFAEGDLISVSAGAKNDRIQVKREREYTGS
jgi:exosome complex RNA-binding protein Rrp4